MYANQIQYCDNLSSVYENLENIYAKLITDNFPYLRIASSHIFSLITLQDENLNNPRREIQPRKI